MRLLVEILIFGTLIYLAWDMPLKQRMDQVQTATRAAVHAAESPAPGDAAVAPQQTVAPTPIPTPIRVPRPLITAPPPTPRGAWMWDAKRQSALDRPAYGQTQPVQRYQDSFGRSYWIDAQGVRHYDQ